MTLRAVLRNHQRQTNISHPIRPARAAERNRYLHLIRRDGRGGFFLPCERRAGLLAGLLARLLAGPINQRKGSVA